MVYAAINFGGGFLNVSVEKLGGGGMGVVAR
jgi:hypothetical protein